MILGVVGVLIAAAITSLVGRGIAVGPQPSSITITPDGRQAYITDGRSYTTSVIDIANDRVVTTLPFFGYGVTISPDGRRAYILGNGVIVVDTASFQTISTINIHGYTGAGSAFSPDGRYLYVGNSYVVGSTTVPSGSGAVEVIDATLNMVVATIPVGISARDLAVTPAGDRIYVANADYGSGKPGVVTVIDTRTRTATTTITVGGYPDDVEIGAGGRRVYVTGVGGSTGGASVIDSDSNLVIDTIPGVYAFGNLAISPDGRRIYFGGGPVIDTNSNMRIGDLSPYAPGFAAALAITPDGSHAYLVDPEFEVVSVVSLADAVPS